MVHGITLRWSLHRFHFSPCQAVIHVTAQRGLQRLFLNTNTDQRRDSHSLQHALDDLLLTDSREDLDKDQLRVTVFIRDNLFSDLLVRLSWSALGHEGGKIEIILGVATFGEQAHLASILVGGKKLVLGVLHERDLHVVGGRAKVLKLLAREDVDGDDVGLRVAVLASLGSGEVDDLGGLALDHNVATLSNFTALHRVDVGRTSVGGLEL